MEEFNSKPITRRTYEYYFIFIRHVGLLNINYFFVNLFLNDQNMGVYAVEESFSKEIVERQKRNGPIFSPKMNWENIFLIYLMNFIQKTIGKMNTQN